MINQCPGQHLLGTFLGNSSEIKNWKKKSCGVDWAPWEQWKTTFRVMEEIPEKKNCTQALVERPHQNLLVTGAPAALRQSLTFMFSNFKTHYHLPLATKPPLHQETCGEYTVSTLNYQSELGTASDQWILVDLLEKQSFLCSTKILAFYCTLTHSSDWLNMLPMLWIPKPTPDLMVC